MSETLWAPWRYDYVASPAEDSPGCIFCGIGRDDPNRDRDNLILHRGALAFVVLNRYPYINGHLMIVPFRHLPDLTALSAEEMTEMMKMAVLSEKALRGGMNCQGMNGGWNIGSAGGAGIPGHLHMHILPRWNGDTNFITTVAGTRVVSQSLEKAHELLSPFFEGA